MSHSLATSLSFERLSIASANLLIETNTSKGRNQRVTPQYERINDHIASFRDIESRLGQQLDLVGLQELQITDDYHNGEMISKSLRMPHALYAPHSRKKVGEHIGAVGRRAGSYSTVELGKNRQAAVVRLGEVCVMFVHLTYTDAQRRHQEYQNLMAIAEAEEHMIVAGDFNEEPLPFSDRRKLGQVGLKSAFVADRHHHPVTLPAPGYGKLRSVSRRIGYGLMGGGLRFDDIYIKGELRVKKTGTVDSQSDHRFPYAQVIGPAGIFGPSDS